MSTAAHRMLECGVILRIYTMVASSLYAWAGLTQEYTLTYAAAHANNTAFAAAIALAVLAVLGAIDVVVNDIMPDRYVIRPALRDRHLVSMGISVCFGVLMWTCVRNNLPLSLLPFYATYVVLVPASAFADVHKRFKNKKDC